MPRQNSLEIQCHPRLIRNFRAAARKRFPEEVYGVFIGRFLTPSTVVIVDLIVCPRENTAFVSQWEVSPEEEWLTTIAKAAQDSDLAVVGDIHTHCSTDSDGFVCETAPSEGDWRSVSWYKRLFRGSYTFMAVMSLHKAKVRMRAKVSFWPLLDEISVTYKED